MAVRCRFAACVFLFGIHCPFLVPLPGRCLGLLPIRVRMPRVLKLHPRMLAPYAVSQSGARPLPGRVYHYDLGQNSSCCPSGRQKTAAASYIVARFKRVEGKPHNLICGMIALRHPRPFNTEQKPSVRCAKFSFCSGYIGEIFIACFAFFETFWPCKVGPRLGSACCVPARVCPHCA